MGDSERTRFASWSWQARTVGDNASKLEYCRGGCPESSKPDILCRQIRIFRQVPNRSCRSDNLGLSAEYCVPSRQGLFQDSEIMPKLRPQHCFWLAAVCFVGGLTTCWSVDVTVVDGQAVPDKDVLTPPGVIRSRTGSAPESSPAVADAGSGLPPLSIPAPPEMLPAVETRGFVTAGYEQAVPEPVADPVPRPVWLSGRIELADSPQLAAP